MHLNASSCIWQFKKEKFQDICRAWNIDVKLEYKGDSQHRMIVKKEATIM
jgi:hypothetical protein